MGIKEVSVMMNNAIANFTEIASLELFDSFSCSLDTPALSTLGALVDATGFMLSFFRLNLTSLMEIATYSSTVASI